MAPSSIQSLKTKFFMTIGVIVFVLIGEYALQVSAGSQIEEIVHAGQNLNYLSFAGIALILLALGFITFFVFKPALRTVTASSFKDGETLIAEHH